MTMHRALGILDVIHTISSHTAHGSLPALASTSHAFKRPALEVLWRDLQSVEPLVRCLPSDLFGVDQGCWALKKPLDDKMWATLSGYTFHVHTITVTQTCPLKFIEALSLIMMSYPSGPASLFPNLRKLTWGADGTRGTAEFLRMASVPTLVTLTVEIAAASPAFLSALSSLQTSFPHLKSLYLKYSHMTDELRHKTSPFITQSISRLDHLHSLAVWDLGNEGMERVMQLRALQSLHLDLGTSSAWEARSNLQFTGFRDLHYLGLSIDTFEQASNLLSSLQVARSREIGVYFTSQHSGESTTLSQFFAILQERCDNDKLRSFTLQGFSRKVHTEPGVFTPLHAFRNLTRLLIANGCVMSMSDEELCQLVRAWPKLQVLKISCHVTDGTAIVPTFHGLISLLRLCPALISLALVIDTTKLEGIDLECPGGGSCNKNLRSLVLGNSPIEVPMNVALILSGLFPDLEKVDLDCWDQLPLCFLPREKLAIEKWVSVNSILGDLSVVRKRCIKAYRDVV